MTSAFVLFVYGTLKRGQRAHVPFCARARFVGEARVAGRLFLHPDGYPVLEVSEDEVLAVGTDDASADASLQEVVALRDTDGCEAPSGAWTAVRGELFAFASPDGAINAIDEYEGLGVSAVRPTYRRVLLRLIGTPTRHAWAYAATSTGEIEGLARVDADAWP